MLESAHTCTRKPVGTTCRYKLAGAKTARRNRKQTNGLLKTACATSQARPRPVARRLEEEAEARTRAAASLQSFVRLCTCAQAQSVRQIMATALRARWGGVLMGCGGACAAAHLIAPPSRSRHTLMACAQRRRESERGVRCWHWAAECACAAGTGWQRMATGTGAPT